MPSFISFPNDISHYLSRLQNEATPKWGIMLAQNMVEHLLLVINVSIGSLDKPLEIVTPIEKIPKYKAILMGDTAFPHEFKAPMLPKDRLIPLKYSDLASAKHALFQGVESFFTYYEENPNAFHLHPVFGNCNFTEWKRFHSKHFTHHFEQFGLLD
jgi:oxepin-CoA hydrolase/3-oxo-5,6-dehydrosuberyl-CoA semialdehyde dehydrogenase